MKSFYLYIIHDKKLTNRVKYINAVIDFIKNTVEKKDYEIKINLITDIDTEYIEKNIEDFNKKVKYENQETLERLNISQISNIEKHKCVYKYIDENILLKNKTDLHLILEDDVLINTEYSNNIISLIDKLSENSFEEKWDILFTCISNNNFTNDKEDLKLVKILDILDILISKSSYFIKPKLAKKLYEYLESYNLVFKKSLYKYLYENKDTFNSYILNKHTFLEGSKIGIVPSSTSPNNILYQNNDFIKLTYILNSGDKISNEKYKEANEIYKNVKDLNSPDIMHAMGIICYKNNNITEAKNYLKDAVLSLKKNKGFLNNMSEILNNCINMHQYEQPYLEECMKLKGKYG